MVLTEQYIFKLWWLSGYDAMAVCLCKHIMLQGSNPVMVFCFGNFEPKSLMTKFGVLVDFWKTPDRLLKDSWWTPDGLLVDSWWTPGTVLMDCWKTPDVLLMDSWWTPDGLLVDSFRSPTGPVAQCKVLSNSWSSWFFCHSRLLLPLCLAKSWELDGLLVLI